MEKPELLTEVLKGVSRTFYLTLRVLPAAVRPPISLAYLLARTSDTIADTELTSCEHRLQTLRDYGQAIQTADGPPPLLAEYRQHQSSGAEERLLARSIDVLACLRSLPASDQTLIRKVLAIIISGQELDLLRFQNASRDRIAALETDEELDDYTYRVAGCVGEFWTQICLEHLYPSAPVDRTALLTNAVRFGKALQLINVLRDLGGDLRMGRCYIPRACLAQIGLAPADLLNPHSESRFRPLYEEYLGKAEAHLAAGWEYTLQLPRRPMRARLACAWPILIGDQTLRQLRQTRALGQERPVKISRRAIRQILFRSIVLYPFPARWRGLFDPRKAPPGNRIALGTFLG